MFSRFDVLPPDVLTNILKKQTYSEVLALSKESEQTKIKILAALKIKETAIKVACNELKLSLDEIDEYGINWIPILVQGIGENIGNLLFLVYEANYFGFANWYHNNRMNSKQKQELIYFLLGAGRIDIAKTLGVHYYLETITNMLKNGYVSNAMALLDKTEDERSSSVIEDFVTEALKLPLQDRRTAFRFAVSNHYVLDTSKPTLKRDKLYIITKTSKGPFLDVTQYGLKNVLCQKTVRETFASFDDAELMQFAEKYFLPNDVTVKYFLHRIILMMRLIKSRPDILQEYKITASIVLEYKENAAMMKLISAKAPADILRICISKGLSELLVRRPEMTEELKLLSRRSLISGDYVEFVSNFTSWKDYLDLIPEITDTRFLHFLSNKGFDLSKLESDEDVITLMFSLPDTVALFEIFPNNLSVEKSVLLFRGGLFTADDILRFGFHLSVLLDVAKVESRETDEVLEELMYSDAPENIQDAITAKILS